MSTCKTMFDVSIQISNKYFVRYPDYKNIIDKDFLVLYGEFIK